MTEGELKKRMKDRYVKEFLGSGERWYNYFWDNGLFTKEEDTEDVINEFEDLFDTVFDEAKKEFHNIPVPIGKPAVFLCSILQWYEKWFGEE